MTRRSGLGKGLSSLIPMADTPAGGIDGPVGDRPVLAEIPTSDVVPNPHQPRVHFDEETLGELAASIAQLGVIQPILVRVVDGRYQLIAGERRWRAAQRAGLPTVPAVIRTSDDVSAVEQALVENLHRQDLTPLEEAAAYQQLLEDFGITQEELASRIGAGAPVYSVLSAGPDHDRVFTATVTVGAVSASGVGTSKKYAEMAAALAAWRELSERA